MIGDIEYKDTGWLGVSCTRDGRFKRNGKPKKIILWHDVVPMITCRDHYRRKECKASDLVAKAWHPQYYDGCYTIPKDGNRANIHIDNIGIVDKKGFFKHRGLLSLNNKIPKIVDWSSYGVFKETPYDGLECTIDGVFRKNNRLLTVYKPKDLLGRKRRCEIRIKIGDIIRKVNAAEIVAMTWSPSSWSEDVVIIYQDGDKHNIHSDNLVLVDRKKYYKAIGENIGYKKVNYAKAFEAVKQRSIEAGLAYRYFQTGDLTEINKYVSGEFYQSLMKYASEKFYAISTVENVVNEAVAILYDHILANRPISDYTKLCKGIIRMYHKKGSVGYYGRTPNHIENIHDLNLDSLCKKFKSTKIR